MTLTEFGPDYSKFTFTELENSIRARAIDTVIEDREQMIRVLQEADRTAIFRLLDLPAELRYLVYKHAVDVKRLWRLELGVNQYKFHADLTIMRACEQIYEEAAPLFVNRHCPQMTVSLGGSDVYMFAIHFNGDLLQRDAIPCGLWPCLKLPPFDQRLQQLKSLKLRVHLIGLHRADPEMAEIGTGRLNEVLHLTYQTMTSSRIQRLNVEIHSDVETIDEQRLRDVLSPISVLPWVVTNTEVKYFNIPEPVRLSLDHTIARIRVYHELNAKLTQSALMKSTLNPKNYGQDYYLKEPIPEEFP